MPQSCRLPPVRPERDGKMIRKVMEVIHQSVGGLDVHKKTVMACRRRLMGDGQVESEVRGSEQARCRCARCQSGSQSGAARTLRWSLRESYGFRSGMCWRQ